MKKLVLFWLLLQNIAIYTMEPRNIWVSFFARKYELSFIHDNVLLSEFLTQVRHVYRYYNMIAISAYYQGKKLTGHIVPTQAGRSPEKPIFIDQAETRRHTTREQ